MDSMENAAHTGAGSKRSYIKIAVIAATALLFSAALFAAGVYAAVEEKALKRKTPLSTYLAVVTKQTPADIEIIEIPKWRREELLREVERSMPHILDVKFGRVEPERCGVCEYCRATKKIKKPIDFELVGLSNAERKAIFGTL